VTSTHLSDEATAAFADGVLSGGARDRATRHVALCQECAEAVTVQREAILRLRAAAAPTLPGSLLARLQSVPQTAALNGPPTVLGSDGSPMFATGARFGGLGARFGEVAGPFSAAAVVPVTNSSPRKRGIGAGGTTLALVALAAGVLTASATADAPAGAGASHTSRSGVVAPAQDVVGTVRFVRPVSGH
jgi:hypothetical protein